MRASALVLQSGGATAVINQSVAGVLDEIRRSKRFSFLFGARFGALGLLKSDFVNLSSLRPSEILKLKQSPSSALGTCRHKLTAREAVSIVQALRKKSVRTAFLIGGNDTAQTSMLLREASLATGTPLQVIGIPKTIDNDLVGMDHTPGYGSVARFMAVATQEAALDTRAARFSDPIKIIETMGRNSGWMVAAASLGRRHFKDGPHLLYFPERAFHPDSFLRDVKCCYQKLGYVVIVIAETIRDAHGNRIGSAKSIVKKDRFGHAYIEGTAEHLCRLIEAKLKVRARFDKPGTIQRMAMGYVSPVDQREAYHCGRHAVRLALQGETGVMVAIQRVSNAPYRIRFGKIDLARVAGEERKLPDSFINHAGNFVTPAFRQYAMPLIGGPIPEYTFLA